MSSNEREATTRLAVHSTHEAAEKIAGIGAVLDGILPQPAYLETFPSSVLVGAYPFPGGNHPLKEVSFDSARAGVPGESHSVPDGVARHLHMVAQQSGTRIVFGRRKVGPRGAETEVDVLLASPSGIRRAVVDAFRHAVRERFGFDLAWYEDNYPAVHVAPDRTLDRILKHFERLRASRHAPDYPIGIGPDGALADHRGRTFYGGIPYTGEPSTPLYEQRALFPAIQSLDSFGGADKTNPYLLELQFYLFAAPPLWQATRILIDEYYRPGDVTLFAHDWLGVPLFWAMRLDTDSGYSPAGNPIGSLYFAHEARIARLLVEGAIKDKRSLLERRCHPDGYDVSFYSYLKNLERLDPPMSLSAAFPELWGPWGREPFTDIFYHALNVQAAHFDRVVAVGQNVKRETEWILRGRTEQPHVFLCPNGIPDFTAAVAKPRAAGQRTALDAKIQGQEEARERLVTFASKSLGFKPDYIFTGVNRCELSKGPWRNVNFFQAFTDSEAYRNKKSLFVWLSRPKPIPTADQVAQWSRWGWPLEHRPQSEGGDLRPEEVVLWEMIRAFNHASEKRHKILYINQFGWDADRLGAMDPVGSTFVDLRVGTDIEIGLSVYEPFGIAPLEPFSSGAVCVLSDSSGCALHLQELRNQGVVSDSGFIVGRFSGRDVDPAQVNLNALREIEGEVYAEIVRELTHKLARPRGERLAQAQDALPHLSWSRATQALLDSLEMRVSQADG